MDKNKIWLAVDITVEANAVEAVEFALTEAGADGTEIDILGKNRDLENIKVVGYFENRPDEDFFQENLSGSLRIYNFTSDSIKSIEWREVENQDWLTEWKKHWKPTVTDKFIIAPPWETVEDTDKIVIKIEPSMAFGTGTHETTRLCLKVIEQQYSPEMSFLDVGTGTGILAIAAAKLKSRVESGESGIAFSLDSPLSTRHPFLGCDTDEDSIKIAKENAEFNNVAGIEFYVGSINDETPKFDFVCANLTADVIVPLLPLLVGKFEKILVLSGILKEQEDWVTSELKKLSIKNCKIEQDGEWISIEIKN